MKYDVEESTKTNFRKFYAYYACIDRKRMLRKIKVEKHDIQWLLAFALYDRYGEKLPKQLWINQDLKEKVQTLV